jgi:hypothetical protein
MTDYWGITLNGLFTGIGVILAHEFYNTFRKYKDTIKKGLFLPFEGEEENET